MDRLILEDIHYWRGEAHVLRGISLRVRAGQQWALLGPNGSGKTTLVDVATGYTPASRGRVYLLEGWLSHIVLPEVRKRVGYVGAALADVMLRWHPRTPALEVVLSGRYASLGLYARPSTEERAQAQALLDEMGAGPLAERPFSILSTGERQICLLARCRMARSELVILDEPCAGLDLAARERLLAEVRRACVARPDTPHLLIVHHPEEILPAITHVALMREGRLTAAGPREAVLTEALLSETFGIPVRMIADNGRIWVRPTA